MLKLDSALQPFVVHSSYNEESLSVLILNFLISVFSCRALKGSTWVPKRSVEHKLKTIAVADTSINISHIT